MYLLVFFSRLTLQNKKISNMKYFFTFLGLIHFFTQTCYGEDTDRVDMIFINNLVDPNEYEMETLTNLVAYPFINITTCSLVEDFGLAVNYTLISSDRYITLPGSNRYRYSMEYFQNLIKNHTKHRAGKEVSLNELHGVLEIISKPSIILMAVNNIPKGKILLNEILETMVAKMSPVIVFQIKNDGSVTDQLMSQRTKDDLISDQIKRRSTGVGDPDEMDVNYFLSRESLEEKIIRIPENFVKNNETLIKEFDLIMDITMDVLFMMAFEEMKLEMNSKQNSNVPEASPKLSYNFIRSRYTRRVQLTYEVIKLTYEELLSAIRPYFRLRHQMQSLRDYLITDYVGETFLSQPDPIIITAKPANFTLTNNSQTTIKSQVKYDLDRSSLKGLRKAMQIIPACILSAQYIFTVIDEVHGILPEFVQNIEEQDLNFLIHGYDNSSEEHKSWHSHMTY